MKKIKSLFSLFSLFSAAFKKENKENKENKDVIFFIFFIFFIYFWRLPANKENKENEENKVSFPRTTFMKEISWKFLGKSLSPGLLLCKEILHKIKTLFSLFSLFSLSSPWRLPHDYFYVKKSFIKVKSLLQEAPEKVVSFPGLLP